jgi:hypothetical protein
MIKAFRFCAQAIFSLLKKTPPPLVHKIWVREIVFIIRFYIISTQTGINITVGHRPSDEQNADMAVYWLLCTDIMADRFVSLIWIFLPSFFNTFKKYCVCDPHNNNVISCVKRTILYITLILCNIFHYAYMHLVFDFLVVTVLVYSTVTTDNVLLEIVLCLL